jgi:hypothetical protein
MEQNDTIVSVLGPPLIVALVVCLFDVLPTGIFSILTAWTFVSIPIGMLVGRCALND